MKQQSRTIDSDCFGLSDGPTKVNGKNKGNNNERACAKSLTEWVGVPFVRVPMSGALRRIDTDKTVGDIIPDTIDKNFVFDFSVETKHLKTITIKKTLSSSSAIFKIWEQPHSDSLRSNKLPMALLRSNQMPKGEYYLILDADRGGRLMAMQVPLLFSGSSSKFFLMGFMFSEVKKLLPYKTFAKAIKQSKFTSNSKLFS